MKRRAYRRHRHYLMIIAKQDLSLLILLVHLLTLMKKNLNSAV